MLIRLGVSDAKVVLRDTGTLLKWSAVTFLVPAALAAFYQEGSHIIGAYLLAAAVALFVGHILKNYFDVEQETGIKHAFLTVTVLWLLYTAVSAIPFSLIVGMPFIDAFFEAMSALTTTGISVMQPLLDSTPASLIFWRSFLSWIGGVGIVVLAMVGILSSYSSASKFMVAAGKEEHIKPNLRNTVKEIWSIYVALTLIGVLLLYFSGMNFFDSVNYSFSAISTTGMDTKSAGLVGMHNPFLDLSLIFIMLMGATSFSLHYLVLKKRQWNLLLEDSEFKVLIMLTLVSAVIIFPKFVMFYGSNVIGLESAFFHAASALTTGGFALAVSSDVSRWGDFVKLILIIVMVIGGASGSTAGGIKISRFIIFLKSVFWRVKSSILPEKTFFAKKFDGKDIADEKIREINQFIVLYLAIIVVGTVVLTLHGNDMGNSLFEVVSAQSNVGISTGISHSGMPVTAEIMLILNMFIGRLEIIPILSALGFLLSFRGVERKFKIGRISSIGGRTPNK